MKRADGSAFTDSSHGGIGSLNVTATGSGVSSTLVQDPSIGGSNTQVDFQLAVTAGLGTRTFTYAVSADRSGGSFPVADLTGTVCVNQIPIARNDSGNVYATGEDSVLLVSSAQGMLSNDSDIAADDTVDDGVLEVSGIAINGVPSAIGAPITLPPVAPSTVGAKLQVESDGSLSYDPTNAFDFLKTGESRTVTFAYTVTDGVADDSATVQLTIEGANDAPRFDDPLLTFRGVQGQTLVLDVLDGVTDPEGDTFAIAEPIAQPPASGLAEIIQDGGTQKIRYTADATFTGTDSFAFRVVDPSGAASELRTIQISTIALPVIQGYRDDTNPRTGDFLFDGVVYSNDATPDIFGIAEANSSISLLLNGTDSGLAASADANGVWTLTLPSSQLNAGQNQFQVMAVSGNLMPSSEAVEYVLDANPPMAEIAPIDDVRNASIPNDEAVTIRFEDALGNDPITGFELGDLALIRHASPEVMVDLSDASLLPTDATVVGQVDYASAWSLINLGSATSQTGSYSLKQSGSGSGIEDRAGNLLSTDAMETFTVDLIDPTVSIDALVSNQFPDSNLPVPVTNNPTPTLRITVTDQQFALRTNSLSLQLFQLNEENVKVPLLDPPLQLTIPQGASDDPEISQTIDVQIALNDILPEGSQHAIFASVLDEAGRSEETENAFFIFFGQAGPKSIGAPGTPVHTSTYDIKAAINGALGLPLDAAIQPWQMSFDKTTQTVWFTTEKAGAVVQFDPATETLTTYDLTGIAPDEGENPHGVFFDFNTHLTPRVWVAHRNAGGSSATVGGDNEDIGRLSYVDVANDTLVTYDFRSDAIKDLLAANGIEDGKLPAFHAVFTDPSGDVWVSSPDAHVIAQFDFDLTDPTLDLDGQLANVTLHPIPESLTEGFVQEFHPHAFQVVVDDRLPIRNGGLTDAQIVEPRKNQWVWAVDIAGSGRVALMRPGLGPNGTDLWTTWDVDQFAGASGAFVQFDDNETPGIPEDDFIVATFPVTSGDNGKPQNNPKMTEGIVHRFSLANQSDPLNSPAVIETWIIPKMPGADPQTNLSATIQPFVDRNGQVFVADRYGSLARFHPSDPAIRASEIFHVQDASPIAIPEVEAIQLGVIAPSMVEPLPSTPEPVAVPRLAENPSFATDHALLAAIDQYEITGDDPAVPERGRGLFRGAINAGNTFYGSLAQSNLLSVTVLAESSRRQLAVVPGPVPTGGAVTQPRMAFQVVRNGSVILTARGNARIADEQLNLLGLLASAGRADADVHRIFGDAAAEAGPDGKVHVVGRSLLGGVVQYTFTPPSAPGTNGWNQEDLTNPINWSVTHRTAGLDEHVLAEDASAAGALGFSVTTAEGHWLQIPFDPDSSAIDLTEKVVGNPNDGLVYSGVGTTQIGETIYGYGTNQTGDLVEYKINDDQVLVQIIQNEQSDPGFTERDTRLLRNVHALTVGQTRHIFGTDGVSRLVHWSIDSSGVHRENVSMLTANQDKNFGYFPFQQPFTGRVYTYVEPMAQTVDGETILRVYGTNGGDLIEFTRSSEGDWHVANLTQDTNATFGNHLPKDKEGNPIPQPRVPANAVFGAPEVYLDANGGRHILQINADGEIVEYYTFGQALSDDNFHAANRFFTQNVNFFSGLSAAELAGNGSADQISANPVSTPVVSPDSTSTPLAAEQEDVNRDGKVTAQDALLIINRLAQSNPAVGETASGTSTGVENYNLDVNGDERVSALDALRVINYLSRSSGQAMMSGEGEFVFSATADEEDSWNVRVDGLMSELEGSELF